MLGTEIKQQFPETIVKENEKLSHYTYTKTGGPADALVFPKTKDEVAAIVAWVNEKQIPLTVLGLPLPLPQQVPESIQSVRAADSVTQAAHGFHKIGAKFAANLAHINFNGIAVGLST